MLTSSLLIHNQSIPDNVNLVFDEVITLPLMFMFSFRKLSIIERDKVINTTKYEIASFSAIFIMLVEIAILSHILTPQKS